MPQTYNAGWVWGYMSSSQFADDLLYARMERLELIRQIATKTWTDYLVKPARCDESVWANVVKRFTVTDLQTPVLTTISSASHGGKINRRIKQAFNKEKIEAAMKEGGYDAFIKERAAPESMLYGTSYVVPGWRQGRFHFTQLSPITTEIITPVDDVEDIQEIVAHFADVKRSYTASGIYRHSLGEARKLLPDTNYGFVPVAIFRGKHMDSSTPYGDDLVFPASQETKQCTYLGNDIMVLERLQSYSTLVIKGSEASSGNKMEAGGPFGIIRLSPGSENDAYYISPQAALEQVDRLIASKLERTAIQCQVPVESFTRAKSGTNQAAGSSYLSHKPLYDLVVSIQERKRREEFELVAMMDAMFSWLDNNKRPVDLEKHRKNLEIEIIYDRESNPSINQNDAQTYESLLSSRFIKHDKGYWKFNPDGTDQEQKELEALRESDRTVDLLPGTNDGFKSNTGLADPSQARIVDVVGK